MPYYKTTLPITLKEYYGETKLKPWSLRGATEDRIALEELEKWANEACAPIPKNTIVDTPKVKWSVGWWNFFRQFKP